MIESLFPLGISQYLVGGLFVGLGISFVFLTVGKVAGASTFFTSTWSFVLKGEFFQNKSFTGTRSWRLLLALGMLLGGFFYIVFFNNFEAVLTSLNPLQLLAGGILVGIGTRMANGCPSGHAICGNATANKDSIVATIVFLTVAIIVAQVSVLII